jgi:hypothetical protein
MNKLSLFKMGPGEHAKATLGKVRKVVIGERD